MNLFGYLFGDTPNIDCKIFEARLSDFPPPMTVFGTEIGCFALLYSALQDCM